MLIAALLALATPAPEPAPVKVWRLDCGTLQTADFSGFSDSHRYDGKGYRLTDSCYLIKHGEDYMLWDTGLPGAVAGQTMNNGGFVLTMKERIVPQLARLGVKPEQIKFVGISHRHSDHTGQALDFPGATLLIGKADFEQLKTSTDAIDRAGLIPWLDGASKADLVTGDRDIFGDGSVVMLNMPGHTAGHHALLLRVTGRGYVLLSGDQFHARESYERNEVPQFNNDRADTLASSDRFRNIATNLGAIVVIQHEPADISKLPGVPN
jgi:glyoxylase-like metal-dependent hydrolase (beta-lactamase superfamily II)